MSDENKLRPQEMQRFLDDDDASAQGGEFVYQARQPQADVKTTKGLWRAVVALSLLLVFSIFTNFIQASSSSAVLAELASKIIPGRSKTQQCHSDFGTYLLILSP